jgi:hypothetical protein
MNYAQKFVAFVAAFLLAGSAWGTVFTFFADGVTEGAAQEGRADFDFSADLSTLTVTLTNNVAPTELIASEIDGLRFGLIGPGSATLTGVSGSVVDCTGVPSPCPSVAGSPPFFSWGLTSSGGLFELGSGLSGGFFSHQPYGIVNTSYTATGSGGLSEAGTNPLLVGPVVFTFALSDMTSLPRFGDVTFLFGAVPDRQTGVPEPQTLALMGIGLLALVFVGRRRKTR